MSEYLLLLVGTVLVNNFVLVKFLGLCPFMGVSRKRSEGSRESSFRLTLQGLDPFAQFS